jgi:serine/threonine-protein phosphatase PP1 catalytic subunit
MCDLLWSDPATGGQKGAPGVKTTGWGPNERGTSWVFSERVVEEFNRKHRIELIVRGH